MDFEYKNNNIQLGFGEDILKNILKSRGIEDVDRFLNLDDSVIEDYHNFDNIYEASTIVMKAVNENKQIQILVDHDSDGFSSASLMYSYLKDICNKFEKEFNVGYIIHNKKSHGLDDYVMEVLHNLKSNDCCDLLIIPDASSNDYKQHEELSRLGIDIVILDHHDCDKYSEYATVVNNQLSNKINDKSMCGVGVVYKFCKLLDERLYSNFADKYLDLVAYGSIADNCDMRNLQTRWLTLKGLELIQNGENNNKLLKELFKKQSYSLKKKATINGFAFYMSPCINCIIRGGDEELWDILFKAFIGTNDKYKDKIRGKGEVELSVEEYVLRRYDKLKRQQNKSVDTEVKKLDEQIEQYGLNKNEILVLNGEKIKDKQYNRIIVNKLSSNYNKHVLLLSKVNNSKEIYGGSATGRDNKEIDNFRKWCEDTGLFDFAEGHPSAFGVQIKYENINKLYKLISTIPSSDKLIYTVDHKFEGKVLNDKMIRIIGGFNDFWGNKIDEPLFAIENVKVNSNDVILQGKTKSTIKFVYNNIDFIKFKSDEEEYNKITSNEANNFTIIGRFSINEYNGETRPQVIITDMKYTKTEPMESNNVNPFKII